MGSSLLMFFGCAYPVKNISLYSRISPEGVDLVLDCLCGEDTNRGISLLKPLGRYILYGEYWLVLVCIALRYGPTVLSK